MTRLDDDAVQSRLAEVPGWELGSGEIVREYRLADFPAAVAFVVRMAFAAEAANHHPDVDLRYNRVRVALSTHSEGGITGKDFDLAAAIQGLAAEE